MQILLNFFKFSLIIFILHIYAHPIPSHGSDEASVAIVNSIDNNGDMHVLIAEQFTLTPLNDQVESSFLTSLPVALLDEARDELHFAKRTDITNTEAPQPVCPHCNGQGCSSCKSGSTRNHLKNKENSKNYNQEPKMQLSGHFSESSSQSRGIQGTSSGPGAHEKRKGIKGDIKHHS